MYNEVTIWIFFFVQQTRIANRLYLRNFNEKVLQKLTLTGSGRPQEYHGGGDHGKSMTYLSSWFLMWSLLNSLKNIYCFSFRSQFRKNDVGFCSYTLIGVPLDGLGFSFREILKLLWFGFSALLFHFDLSNVCRLLSPPLLFQFSSCNFFDFDNSDASAESSVDVLFTTILDK